MVIIVGNLLLGLGTMLQLRIGAMSFGLGAVLIELGHHSVTLDIDYNSISH